MMALIFSQTENSDLEYVDDFMLLNEDSSKSQDFLNRLNDSKGVFGVHFTQMDRLEAKPCASRGRIGSSGWIQFLV